MANNPQASLDYHRVARALRFLEERRMAHPGLRELSDAVGLSPFHTQRLFQRWAGVSPKRFQQYLTREHARRLLGEGCSVGETTRRVGLSSAGRLHDLFVNTEGVTPGQHRGGAAGLEIDYGYHPTPFGEALLGTTERGVCYLAFVTDAEDGRGEARRGLAERFVGARLNERPRRTAPLVERVFELGNARRSKSDSLGVLLRGSQFQLRVWQALLAIPAGEVRSYGGLARQMGAPRSARAVGNALASNPIAVLIPCHRVLRAMGDVGNYAWGAERKRLLLAWESGRSGADG